MYYISTKSSTETFKKFIVSHFTKKLQTSGSLRYVVPLLVLPSQRSILSIVSLSNCNSGSAYVSCPLDVIAGYSTNFFIYLVSYTKKSFKKNKKQPTPPIITIFANMKFRNALIFSSIIKLHEYEFLINSSKILVSSCA